MDISAKNAGRFSGFADTYDQARPKMPLYPVEIITRYLHKKPDLVIDLGCGTGLSTLIWKGRCGRVIGIEPNDDMREAAKQKSDESTSFIKAFAHETGLDSGCADAVICSQSFHWMNPEPTLKEVDRILKQGGVFATVDCDWPPVCDWRAEKAYSALTNAVKNIERQNPDLQDGFIRWDKNKHLQNIKNSGYFRYARELVFANTESCGAGRLIGIAMSQGSLQGVLKKNSRMIEEDLKMFNDTIHALFGDKEFEADFGYRMRIGIK